MKTKVSLCVCSVVVPLLASASCETNKTELGGHELSPVLHRPALSRCALPNNTTHSLFVVFDALLRALGHMLQTIHAGLNTPVSSGGRRGGGDPSLLSSARKADLQARLRMVDFILVDEFSMIGQTLLGLMSIRAR